MIEPFSSRKNKAGEKMLRLGLTNYDKLASLAIMPYLVDWEPI